MLQRLPVRQEVGLLARRPAVGAAVLVMLGVLCHDAAPHWPGVWIVGVGVTGVAALLSMRWAGMSSIWLASGLMLAGVAAGQVEHFYYPRGHVGLFVGEERRLAQVEFRVEDPPREVRSQAGVRPLGPRQHTRGSVRRVLTSAGWEEASGTVLVTVDPPDARLRVGQTVRAVGWLGRAMPAMNPGEFDHAGYYRRERVLATFSVRRAGNLVVFEDAGWEPLARLRSGVRGLLAAGFGERLAVDHALLRALLLGDRDPLLREIQDLFVRTGTSHHLAISGLHVAVLGGFVYFLCRIARLTPRVTAVGTLGFVVFYGVVALPSPPVVRSVLLCAFVIVGTLGKRSADLVQLLGLSVLAMLVWAPLDLYDVGFQLSFGTVLGLMLFTRPLAGVLAPVDADVALAPKARRTVVRDLGRWARKTGVDAVAAALVAWFVSLPMILYHFDRVNPWATASSIAMAPVVFASLIGGLLKVVLTLVCPWGAGVWAEGAAVPVGLMRLSVDWLARLPGSDVTVRAVPVGVMVAYYGLLWGAAAQRVRKGWARGMVGVACLLIVLTPVVRAWAEGRGGETRVTVLAVGAGNCAVVELADGTTVVVDAGSSSNSDLYRRVIEPYLRERGIRHVEAVFVSHANYDHFSAVGEMARGCGVGRVYVGPGFRHEAEESPAARALLGTLREAGCPVEDLAAGDVVEFGETARVEVVWPSAGVEMDTNNMSLVLRLVVNGRAVLFPGDVQAAAMGEMLAEPEPLRADVLVAPHHGSADDRTPEFLETAGAGVVISSNDHSLTMKQRQFGQEAEGLYRTSECGAVTVKIRRGGPVEVETFYDISIP